MEDLGELKPVASILNTSFNDIESQDQSNSAKGIPVNFYDFDAMTQGLQPGNLMILGGRPAMGKTSFGLNLARNIAQLHHLPICIFSLDMLEEQLTYRLLSMEIGIEAGRLRTGRLQQEEWPLLREGLKTLSQMPIFISDKRNITVKEMTSTCKKVKKQQGKELGLVLIDYFQLMNGQVYNSRKEELSAIAIALKAMAADLKVPVIVISQLKRRRVESRKNKRPMSRDLCNTNSLEPYADSIFMVYRDEYYNPQGKDQGITEIIFSKQRNGPVGTVKLLFEPQFTRFRNLAA
mgnify:CR=1 FL=1|tara:strand:+ start:66 stop:941 length:876 start_codon:yes stop_codon:yes gene_type:complete